MALTILQQPDALSFSGNPIVFRLQSNAYLDTAGSVFVGYFNKSAGLFATGAKVAFEFGDEFVEMVAATNPDDSGYQFPSDSAINKTADQLLPYFQSNYILNKYFTISVNGSNVVFTAREKGEFYQWKNTPLLITSTAGTDAKERANFKFLFEIFIEGANGFENIYSEEINPDKPLTGIATIDISKNLNAALSPDIPDFASPLPFTCSKSKKRYFCRFAEVWGSPAKPRKYSESAVKHVVNGGLSHVGFKTKTLLTILSPVAGDASKDIFLKQGSRQIRTRTNQPEYLYFVNMRGANTALRLKTTVVFTDNTEAEVFSIAHGVTEYSKVGFACGYDLLQLGTMAGAKTIKEYSCRLVNQLDAVVSEVVTYRVDFEKRDKVKYFCSNSSLGGFDTLVAYGSGSEEYELTQSTAEKPKRVDYQLEDGNVTNYDLRIQRAFTVSTGFMDKRRYDLLADFYLAEKKFIVKSGKALPITLVNKKGGQYKDKQGQIAQTLEYQYNFDDDKYTEGDVEESGDYIDGFFFTSNLSPCLPSTETDPTVPLYVKGITPQEILDWNAVAEAFKNGTITGPAINEGNFIKNQVDYQPGAEFYISKGRFETELGIPHDLGSGYKVKFSFKQAAGTGGTPPAPPITDLSDYYNKSAINNLFGGIVAITGYNKANWDSAFTNQHTHGNKSVLDGITSALIGNWNTAFGWGNHAAAGYAAAGNVYDKTTGDGRYAYKSHNHAIADVSGLQTALDGKVEGSSNTFIRNQASLQPGAEFYVNKGRFESELAIPNDLGSSYKVRFSFKSVAGSGGTAPPPPITDLSNYYTKAESNGRFLQLTGGIVGGSLKTQRFYNDSLWNADNARNHFTQFKPGNISVSTGWIAAAFGDNLGNRVVIGQYAGKAVIGAHAANLDNWADLYLNEAGGKVFIGGSGEVWHSGNLNPSNYYLASNPSGFISGITAGMVSTALGYTPYNPTNYPINLNGETLQSITDRGATTTKSIGIGTTALNAKLNIAGGINFQLASISDNVIFQSGSNPALSHGWKLMQDELINGDIVLKRRENSIDRNVFYGQRSTGNVIIGELNPSATTTNYRLLVKRATDRNFGIGLEEGELSIEAFNDVVNSNIPIRYYASKHSFLNGFVGVGATTPDYNFQVRDDNSSASVWRSRIGIANSSADRQLFMGIYNGNAVLASHANALNNWKDLYLNTITGTDGGKTIASDLTVNNALYIPHNLGSQYKVRIKFVG